MRERARKREEGGGKGLKGGECRCVREQGGTERREMAGEGAGRGGKCGGKGKAIASERKA